MDIFCFITLTFEMETFSYLLLVKTNIPLNHIIVRFNNNSKHSKSKEIGKIIYLKFKNIK